MNRQQNPPPQIDHELEKARAALVITGYEHPSGVEPASSSDYVSYSTFSEGATEGNAYNSVGSGGPYQSYAQEDLANDPSVLQQSDKVSSSAVGGNGNAPRLPDWRESGSQPRQEPARREPARRNERAERRAERPRYARPKPVENTERPRYARPKPVENTERPRYERREQTARSQYQAPRRAVPLLPAHAVKHVAYFPDGPVASRVYRNK